MNKLTKIAPEWHAKIAAELTREFSEVFELAETARMRRLRLGFMFVFVKSAGKEDGSIPHGQFGEWMEKNCPAIPRRTAGEYITEANSVCDLLGWQNGEIRQFEPHRLLAAPEDALNKTDMDRRKKLLKIVEQSDKIRAITQYKQVEIRDDATVGRRGQLKGSKGLTKDMREKAAARTEAERAKEFKETLTERIAWLFNIADAEHLGHEVAADQLDEFIEAADTASGFAKRLLEARKKGGAK